MANGWGSEESPCLIVEYVNLGTFQKSRCQAYRELFKTQIPDEGIHLVERACEYCQLVASQKAP
jgi:hypothetical protein